MTKFLVLVFFLLAVQKLHAETVKTIFNPFSSKLDYITRLDTSTAISVGAITTSGDTGWMTSSVGPVLTDSTNCTWRATVSPMGVLSATLVRCPTTTPCTPGVPYGLLLAFTCPRL